MPIFGTDSFLSEGYALDFFGVISGYFLDF